ncbi:dihydrodipicolinate synthetase [Ruminiclostridium papyrosolvens DSM 2782]|uniref:Dihydrodipicolinate synthetase n=1 Tax=Ruminiclostridium papyrosolvens DSM 2782 TaxID=588581 RepID=F1TI19_9FIRM|nr:dihydrodipicolinate synthase family protein [Ruminiclostridium papyrosolvens]EGD45954.1 dihydrodipicolinate synthetase [Ruminiclostridium papyrosolvens DSM 2782]WES33656.1 dihydrodipicolinate synthase family protein [Ruminiclostridium papyrosolvens DSM 2782]
MKKLYGVTTAMVTPFDRNGNVDIKAVSGIVEFLISKGVNCLYPLGTTGEMYHLSVEERKAVAETVVKSANGRVTVYIHVGAMCQNDTIELAKHANEIGADGIGVVTPSFFGVNDREIEEYYVAVAKSVPADFPIYLYNIPQCSANDLKADVAQRIAERCENVVGIKYSYPDFVRTQQYLGIREGNFSVLIGADRLLNVALAMGCSGVVSGVSCVYPEPFVDIYKAFMDGNIEEAARIQKIAVRYVETLKGGSNMSFFKEALKLRGIDAGYMRAPQLDITKDEVELLNEQLNRIGYKK